MASELLRCPEPDCDGTLRLLNSVRFGRFYGCDRFYDTGCRGKVGADRSGKPRGIPIRSEFRGLRPAAHRAFDVLWRERGVSRGRAYRWLAALMGRNAVHIAELVNPLDLARVIAVSRLAPFRPRRDDAVRHSAIHGLESEYDQALNVFEAWLQSVSPDDGEAEALTIVNEGRSFLDEYDEVPTFDDFFGYTPGDR